MEVIKVGKKYDIVEAEDGRRTIVDKEGNVVGVWAQDVIADYLIDGLTDYYVVVVDGKQALAVAGYTDMVFSDFYKKVYINGLVFGKREFYVAVGDDGRYRMFSVKKGDFVFESDRIFVNMGLFVDPNSDEVYHLSLNDNKLNISKIENYKVNLAKAEGYYDISALTKDYSVMPYDLSVARIVPRSSIVISDFVIEKLSRDDKYSVYKSKSKEDELLLRKVDDVYLRSGAFHGKSKYILAVDEGRNIVYDVESKKVVLSTFGKVRPNGLIDGSGNYFSVVEDGSLKAKDENGNELLSFDLKGSNGALVEFNTDSGYFAVLTAGNKGDLNLSLYHIDMTKKPILSYKFNPSASNTDFSEYVNKVVEAYKNFVKGNTDYILDSSGIYYRGDIDKFVASKGKSGLNGISVDNNNARYEASSPIFRSKTSNLLIAEIDKRTILYKVDNNQLHQLETLGKNSWLYNKDKDALVANTENKNAVIYKLGELEYKSRGNFNLSLYNESRGRFIPEVIGSDARLVDLDNLEKPKEISKAKPMGIYENGDLVYVVVEDDSKKHVYDINDLSKPLVSFDKNANERWAGLLKGESDYLLVEDKGMVYLFKKGHSKPLMKAEDILDAGLIKGESDVLVVKNGGKYTLVDERGNRVIDREFDYIYPIGLVRGERECIVAREGSSIDVYLLPDFEKVNNPYLEIVNVLPDGNNIVFIDEFGDNVFMDTKTVVDIAIEGHIIEKQRLEKIYSYLNNTNNFSM